MHEPSWRFRAIIHAGFVNVTPLMAWQWIVPWRSQWLQIFFFTRIVPLTWPFGSWMPAGMIFCILQAALRSKHYTEVTFHCETARNLLHVATGNRVHEHKIWFGTPFLAHSVAPRFVHKCVHENQIPCHCLGGTGISHRRAGQVRREEIPYLCTTSRKIVWNI